MLSSRGWSYSDSKRRHRRGAYRVRRSASRPSATLLARVLASLAAFGLALALWWYAAPNLAMSLPVAEAVPTPTPLAAALLPLATAPPTQPPTPAPTRAPTPSPTPEVFKPLLPKHRILAFYG